MMTQPTASALKSHWKPRAHDWKRGSARVVMVPQAEIADGFRPGQVNAHHVREALLGMEPWEGSEPVIETMFGITPKIEAIVAPNQGQAPVWGKHVRHTRRDTQLSPFIYDGGNFRYTDCLTVELVGLSSAPKLIRAYPGDYVPPLPWQVSAANFDGGIQECLRFWKTHSFIHADSLIVPESQTDTVPYWYK